MSSEGDAVAFERVVTILPKRYGIILSISTTIGFGNSNSTLLCHLFLPLSCSLSISSLLLFLSLIYIYRLYKADDTFHAIGNTPPRDLFSGLTRPPLDDPLRASRNQYLLPKAFPYYPHILSFACCDMRSVLFTLWLHRCMYLLIIFSTSCIFDLFLILIIARNLHPVFVISDSSPPVIARDLIILQLAVSAPVNNSSKGITLK